MTVSKFGSFDFNQMTKSVMNALLHTVSTVCNPDQDRCMIEVVGSPK
jgi:hypothetical protein